jgi:hypothetical protein
MIAIRCQLVVPYIQCVIQEAYDSNLIPAGGSLEKSVLHRKLMIAIRCQLVVPYIKCVTQEAYDSNSISAGGSLDKVCYTGSL